MPAKRRRRLLFSTKDSNWASIIPSVYSLSLFDFDSPYLSTLEESRIASFYQYVEDQRLNKGPKDLKSLKDIAIEMLIQNLSKISSLEDVPKHLTRYMWNTLGRRSMLSFHSWKLLSKSLYTEEDITLGVFHYSKTVRSPRSPLHIYTRPLTSITFDFIASLSITFACTVVELVQLADISNLGILEIIQPESWEGTSSGIGNIVLREWGRQAEQNRSFSVLRVLRLWNHKDLTEKSFHYIHLFPALAVFSIRSCSIGDADGMAFEAQKTGWVTVRDTSLCEALERTYDGDHHKLPVGYSSGFRSTAKSSMKALWPGSKVSRMERSQVRSSTKRFGTTYSSISTSDQHLPGSGPISNTDAEQGAQGYEKCASVGWDTFYNGRFNEPWESGSAACWARIGEIRDDQDLLLAGVKGIEKQTLVGEHLVSPVPMAYICLGGEDPSWTQVQATSGKPVSELSEHLARFRGCLTFIRTKLHSRPASSSPSANGFQLEKGENVKRKAGEVGRLRTLKRQRLGDVLKGFHLV